MQIQLDLTEGWTSPIDYDLEIQTNGAWASFNATSMTPSLVLKDKDGTVIAFAGTVSWQTAATSRIRFSPAATDFVNSKSPYTLHWKVTDTSSKVAFYPQGEPIIIVVHPT
jgi:hypothetical protein